MKYMGSKRRIAKDILPIILNNRKDNQYYVEPFCGGCNTIDKVPGLRIASDINPYLIALLKHLQDNEFNPPFITEEMYKDIRNNKENYPGWLVGYCAFEMSFGAKYFGGYAKNNIGTNYNNSAKNSLLKQQPFLKGIEFYCVEYDKLSIPKESIIYCDIPYKNTTNYKNTFDHDKFYEWCFEKKTEGHEIFISEYNMPSEFNCVWEGKIKNTLKVDDNSKDVIERLFTI